MINLLSGIDLVVFAGCMLLFIWGSFKLYRGNRSASNYFMADYDLPWWSVAGSIYGTNVSLSQIIGMLGIGYSIGFAQSHYELLAIPAILMLCYVFIPAYRKKKAFTLSAFLGDRYNETARLLYTLVIIAVIIILLVGGFYIGSRQLGLLFKGSDYAPTYLQGIILIAIVTCMLVFYGGMRAVVRIENIITILMVIAVVTVGVCTLWQPEIGGFTGLLNLDKSDRGFHKMNLYLPSDHPDLPWTGVFSGLLILHGFFWTTNQFEVQRVMAARSERDAQLGAIAAGFLKLTIPFFSIAAGVAAAYLFKYKYGMTDIKPDDAFIYLIGQVVPKGFGLTGLIMAGFLGAIFSSIYSMLNSLSTITAIDIFKRYLYKNAEDKFLVFIGKISVIIACLIGVLLAWWSFDPNADGNFFLILSKNTSYLKPGVVSAFFLAVLWKRVHPLSAAVAIIIAPLLSFGVEFIYDDWLSGYPYWRNIFGERLNFMHRVFVVFVICLAVQIGMSLKFNHKEGENLLNESIQLKRTVSYLIVQLIMLILIFGFDIDPRVLAIPAALTSFLVLINFRELKNTVMISSSLLLTITTWTLYYFTF
jgi:SSS family solute:Na+ symporter